MSSIAFFPTANNDGCKSAGWKHSERFGGSSYSPQEVFQKQVNKSILALVPTIELSVALDEFLGGGGPTLYNAR